MSRDTRSLDLCILFKFIFLYIPLIHSAPFLRFSHSLLYTSFFSCILLHEIFFLIPDDAVARNLIIICNFSSQRPYLNYIFLSKVYSFDTMEFSMKHKCYLAHDLPTKLQAMLLLFNKSESLECAKVVVLKLGAILFYSGIHFKPLKL